MNAATHAFTPAPAAPLDVPRFEIRPQIGRWSMIAYEGGQPLEYNFGAKDWTLKQAIRSANAMTFNSCRRRFVLRNPAGQVLRDQAWNPMLDNAVNVTMRAIHGRRKRSTAASPTNPPLSEGSTHVAIEARDGEGSAPHALPGVV